ncbi:DUF2145 domain-containing protein [Algibacillus agarilyticus]|uniref:DUF2145 domain-containing protein n=1 Tax=Algibacillus agarilyticus TaxID=2234133 RepID=UPI000DCF88AB|nr:DUF2145 domain-containing protein [Algibacillus agarilyticus]
MKIVKQLIIGLFILPSLCWAGSAKTEESQFDAKTVAAFAKQTEKYVAAQGARVFIIGRVGRPESELPKGIKFTHTAIAVYSDINLDDGTKAKGYAIHNLYQQAGAADKSQIIIDYPTDFFWGVHSLKAGIIIPTPDVQMRLLKAIGDGQTTKLHNPNYSVIANPFTNEFQNCTEHTLDMINAAIYGSTDIKQLKANAKAYFKPQRIEISPLKLMLGNLFIDDVTTKDHGRKIYTTTFSSISRYLADNNLSQQAVILDAEGNIKTL